MRIVLARIALATLAAVAVPGCSFEGNPGDGYLCGAGNACPDGTSCSPQGRCIAAPSIDGAVDPTDGSITPIIDASTDRPDGREPIDAGDQPIDAADQPIDAADQPIDAADGVDAGVIDLPSSFIPCSGGQVLRAFAADDLPKPIPDDNAFGVTSTVVATGSGQIARVAVVIKNLQHDYDEDLAISLITPSDGTINLSSGNGGKGQNYVNTVLDSSCDQSVTGGNAPFSNCFRPEASLAPINGSSAAGTFQLKVVDSVDMDNGDLNDWALALCVDP